jgi:hypothetical protein
MGTAIAEIYHRYTVRKSQYSEAEAARDLGITVEHLRAIIRSHVTDHSEDLNNVPSTTFQASDLVILRLLMSHHQIAC